MCGGEKVDLSGTSIIILLFLLIRIYICLTIEELRLEGTSGHHLLELPLLKHFHLELVVQGRVQTAFEHLQ